MLEKLSEAFSTVLSPNPGLPRGVKAVRGVRAQVASVLASVLRYDAPLHLQDGILRYPQYVELKLQHLWPPRWIAKYAN